MRLTLTRQTQNDSQTDILRQIHSDPTVSRYISISDNYFEYVTGSENASYYKICFNNELIGGIHSEIDEAVLYLSICIQARHRGKGLATAALKKFISLVPDTVQKIKVSIDETNMPSVKLFEGLGFSKGVQDGELVDYNLDLKYKDIV